MQGDAHPERHEEIIEALESLRPDFQGEVFTEYAYRLLYATDASVYREIPLAVARPRTKEDIRLLIRFAREWKVGLIPRTAGTSLAGQVVGNGIIVDVSRYMTRILEINAEESWVKVEPGVILDELNKLLQPLGLFFGPETSTSNRCMIAGMVGNNSCGAHSLVYGSTRDHTLELEVLLSDGSEAVFGAISADSFKVKTAQDNLEGRLYKQMSKVLSRIENVEEIRAQYPEAGIHRRNTGFALDLLLDCKPFTENGPDFNFCRLLAGSEGTLAFTTAIKLKLVPLPPPVKALVCVHCARLEDAFEGNLIALRHAPVAVELMDKAVLDQTKNNLTQRQNRFFIEGDPAAILIVEFAAQSEEEIRLQADAMEEEMRAAGKGYHFPRIFGRDIKRIWELRKAGLGVLSNIPGDAKPVAVIEDTAVSPEKLPAYMRDFNALLEKHGLSCVYYAHIATGELHLRPVLNLKEPSQVELFYTIALETAHLVKKYRGSLSGEHGDGRLRGQFIPLMLGEKVYGLLKQVKETWDPDGIFNPGKITDTPAMNHHLRFDSAQTHREPDTIFDFSDTRGIIRATEQCNGSGDCRKTEVIGGTMCPSYMATREEHTTTRARANILREYLSHSPKQNPYNHQEIYDVMDLCLSCKACKSECPSNVDIAKYKAEFLQHYYDSNGIPLRTLLIANIAPLSRLAFLWPRAYHWMTQHPWPSGKMKQALGFAEARSFPRLADQRFRVWMRQHLKTIQPVDRFPNGSVFLFADEFTEYNDAHHGSISVLLLNALGYYVRVIPHPQSGRAYLSKGLVRKAARLARRNVKVFKDQISEETPLIGIEPSAILSFRDEYPQLVGDGLKDAALELGKHAYLLEEFLSREMNAGRIRKEQFHREKKKILLHGHCHQKALSSTAPTKAVLSLPENYEVEEIPSGCCGMAGSFGYEVEHYEISMRVGELVLFPAVRKAEAETIIVAPGTSCRHQIADGTEKKALHPAEVLFAALA